MRKRDTEATIKKQRILNGVDRLPQKQHLKEKARKKLSTKWEKSISFSKIFATKPLFDKKRKEKRRLFTSNSSMSIR